MIKGFKHKGLQKFFETGSKKGIQPKHANQLRDILSALDASTSPRDMGAPNFRLHLLEPRNKNIWPVYVAKNWSVNFRCPFPRAGISSIAAVPGCPIRRRIADSNSASVAG